MKKALTLFVILLLSAVFPINDAMCAGLNTKVLAKSGSSWDGKVLPDYPAGKSEITILRITIPAKSKLPMHNHPVINAGVLLKGRLTVITKDNKILHLKAGDALIEVVDTIHYGVNEDNEPAEIIVFYAGIKGKEVTKIKP